MFVLHMKILFSWDHTLNILKQSISATSRIYTSVLNWICSARGDSSCGSRNCVKDWLFTSYSYHTQIKLKYMGATILMFLRKYQQLDEDPSRPTSWTLWRGASIILKISLHKKKWSKNKLIYHIKKMFLNFVFCTQEIFLWLQLIMKLKIM